MKTQIKKSSKYVITAAWCIAAVLVCGAVAHAGIEENIVKTETGFYYTVQKGDTLWDLSQKFSDSPWQWPDLWHYNPEIENPHWIYPGQRIRIYRKTFYGETDKEEEKEAPRPEPKKFLTYSKINRVGFIREQEVNPRGVLFQARHSQKLISDNDKVYFEPVPGANLEKGDHYLLYRTRSPIRDPETSKYIGVQHLLTGIVEVTELEKDLGVGRIVVAFRDIQEDDKIMPFMPRPQKMALKPGIAGIEGKIIKSEDDWKAFGDQFIAFIDKGSDHGIEVGQQYKVLCRIMKNSASSSEEIKHEEVGSLVVLHTEDQTATTLITNSEQELSAGMPIQAMR